MGWNLAQQQLAAQQLAAQQLAARSYLHPRYPQPYPQMASPPPPPPPEEEEQPPPPPPGEPKAEASQQPPPEPEPEATPGVGSIGQVDRRARKACLRLKDRLDQGARDTAELKLQNESQHDDLQ